MTKTYEDKSERGDSLKAQLASAVDAMREMREQLKDNTALMADLRDALTNERTEKAVLQAKYDALVSELRSLASDLRTAQGAGQ